MKLNEFDFHLPAASIAQQPPAERDGARMMLLDRASGGYDDRRFVEFPDLLRGDELLVMNNTKVIPARLFGRRAGVRHELQQRSQNIPSGEFLSATVEVLLLRRLDTDLWEALVRPGRKVPVGERIVFIDDDGFAGASEGAWASGSEVANETETEGEKGTPQLYAEVVERGERGLRHLRFGGADDTWAAIERVGHVPLPPYIKRADEPADRERYQTVYAARPGSVAAPTAGLHFTPKILERLKLRGIETCDISLDVGLGTFQPIEEEDLDHHPIHTESYEIPSSSAAAIGAARRAGRPILAVGTTVVRTLEDAAQKAISEGRPPEAISPGISSANLFIRPGHSFALVEQMLTNFHLPRSTLLALVAAFAGREHILSAYEHAVRSGYRFYSYGDCMLIR